MNEIRCEVLYPEYANLYGDTGNLLYLRRKLEAMGCALSVAETHLGDRPLFAEEPVELLYLGPCTERQQETIARELMPYKEALRRRLEDDTALTLFTGNAVELLGQYVENEDGSRFDTLGLTNLCAKRFTRLRFNDLCVGKWDDIRVVGFKNQLSHSYVPEGETAALPPFLQMQRGSGYAPESTAEGVCRGGFIATYLLGPLLPLNPALTHRLLHKITDAEPVMLPFEQEAYEARLQELLS